jgi:fumarate hydratase subunit beta
MTCKSSETTPDMPAATVIRKITAPLDDKVIASLNAGDIVHITGRIYTARDAAHKRLCDAVKKGDSPPFDFTGAIVYYAGPSPAPPGKVIGAIGPTTSGRMDKYAPFLMEQGLKAMIGKGERSLDVIQMIKKHNGVYFAATGGAAALLSKRVERAFTVAYEDLVAEAITALDVLEFPVIVAIDSRGVCVYDRV